MKKLLTILICAATILSFVSCEKEEKEKPQEVKIQLVYPEGSQFSAKEGVEVILSSTTTEASFSSTTDNNGLAVFQVLPGLYETSASDVRAAEGTKTLFNGVKSNIMIDKNWEKTGTVINLILTESKQSQLIIKELYCGGCQKGEDDWYAEDQYCIIYNNSETEADLNNLCFAVTCMYNATMGGDNADIDDATGNFWYAVTDQSPAGSGIWTFKEGAAPKLGAYEEIVIVISGAIDHSKTYPNSVDLSNGNYYPMYDPESGFENPSTYPNPSSAIPTNHYLRAFSFGMVGNAWSFSINSPGFFIFIPKDGETPDSFVARTDNENYYNNIPVDIFKRKMVPNSWVLDAMDVFVYKEDCNKRFTDNVDSGHIDYIAKKGYSLYRNVDKAATEALPENEGKLVYGYTGGTTDIEGGNTDPSNIDAEASIKNGAKIIYMDTNNSSNDFHMREFASLKK